MSEMTKRHKKNEKKLYLDFCCDTRNMCSSQEGRRLKKKNRNFNFIFESNLKYVYFALLN